MLTDEYAAAVKRVAVLRDEDPERFSTVVFHVGLIEAATVLADIEMPAEATP